MFKDIVKGVLGDFSKYIKSIKEFSNRRKGLNSNKTFRKLRKDFYTNVVIVFFEASVIVCLFVVAFIFLFNPLFRHSSTFLFIFTYLLFMITIIVFLTKLLYFNKTFNERLDKTLNSYDALKHFTDSFDNEEKYKSFYSK